MKIAYLLLALLLSACSFGAAQPTPTVELPTVAPPTPTTEPGIVLLIAPEGADAGLLAEAQAAASGFAAAQGLQFEQRAGLTAAELPATLQAAVLLADTGLQELASAAPQVRFIAIGFAPAEPLPNVTSLSAAAAAGSQDAAFIAGYIAAMSANDWRTGMLYGASDAGLVAPYSAGAAYFCGACVPAGPPNSTYPIAVQAAPDNWQAAIDQFMINFVRVVYITPEMENSGAAQHLASLGIMLIGTSAPPADVAHQWVASVSARSGDSLQTQLQQALAGQAPNVASGLAVEHVNPSLFSQSRLEFVQITIGELLSGVLVWQTGQ
ncbi:MAG: hypothetical protein KIT08_08375 [Anaerolineales bacterium]|nr:MAG: hypothetical protein KIT08_08375 [Anaerolineales bacterium]